MSLFLCQGYSLASQLGHSIVDPVPSLFTFKIEDPRLADLSGVIFFHNDQNPLLTAYQIINHHCLYLLMKHVYSRETSLCMVLNPFFFFVLSNRGNYLHRMSEQII